MDKALPATPKTPPSRKAQVVRGLAGLLLFAGVATEVWMFTQAHGALTHRGHLMFAGIPPTWIGGVIGIRWGELSQDELARYPRFLRRLAP